MNVFDRLAAAAREQGEEGELPSWLLEGILEIAGAPERHAGHLDLVQLLLEQVLAFDSYAGTGCFGDSVSAGTIQATLNLILRGQGEAG